MILQSLDALYDRLVADERYDIAPRGYSRQKITFKVVLRRDGTLVDIQDARVPEDGRLRPRPVRVLGETKPSGSGLNPCLLWDNSSYLVGYKKDDPAPKRTSRAFCAFRDRHLELRGAVKSPAFDAVCAFLASWDPSAAGGYSVLEDAAVTGFGVFQFQGETTWVHEDVDVDRWWRSTLTDGDVGPSGQCLVSGGVRPIAKLHRKVKGVVGTQGAGAPLVGFNADAFESYGKDQSYNAPVSEESALRYTSALNALLDGPASQRHKVRVGDTTVAFWTDRPSGVEDVFAPFLDGGWAAGAATDMDEALVQKLALFLAALRQGREAYSNLDRDSERTGFYMLGLSPNAGRVAVRFFCRSSVADLLDNLRRHYFDIAQVPQPSGRRAQSDPEYPSAWDLMRQTARDAKDVPAVLGGALLRSILTGSDYPSLLFTSVLRRIDADRHITYLRACALKGYLQRNLGKEVPMSLDSSRPEPAYRLGRLFATLEKTQKDALGEGLNRTVRDAFYGSASATPAVVFPRLIRTYQHHIAKLAAGFRVNREMLVQEILGPIDTFPAHLGLADQGLFAIGYYHQMQAFYDKRRDGRTEGPDTLEARS